MYFIYVLQSKKNGKKYVGFTGKTVEERLKEHNNGTNQFTRQNGPFELLFAESHADKTFAMKRERFLKSGHGRSYLKRKLKDLNN